MNERLMKLPAIALAFSIAGCGGGGNGMVRPENETRITPRTPIHDDRLSPFVELGSDWHVGANIAPDEAMQVAMTSIGIRGGVTAKHGRVADRASAAELSTYFGTLEGVDDRIGRQEGGLRVVLPNGADAAMVEYTTRAIRMVNAALPHRIRLRLDTERVADDGTLVKADVEPGTLVIVERPQLGTFAGRGGTTGRPPFEEWLAGRPRTNENVEAYNRLLERGYSNGGWVEIDPKVLEPRRSRGFDGTTEWEDRSAVRTFVHELIHAMGIVGHPDRERFTESVMRYSESGENQHVLYGIDYDALLALYELIEPETTRVPIAEESFRIDHVRKSEAQLVEELGPWANSSTHILGELTLESGTVTFGARAGNGARAGMGTRAETVHARSAAVAGSRDLAGRNPRNDARGENRDRRREPCRRSQGAHGRTVVHGDGVLAAESHTRCAGDRHPMGRR